MDNYPEPGQIRAALLRQLLKDINGRQLKGAEVTKVEVIPGKLVKPEPSREELEEMDPKDLEGSGLDATLRTMIEKHSDPRDEAWDFGNSDSLDDKSPEEIAEKFGTGSDYMSNLKSNKALRKWQEKQDTKDMIDMRKKDEAYNKSRPLR